MENPPPEAGTHSPEEDVRLAAGGDRSAFDRLVLRHQDDVVNTVAYFCGDYEDAVDVAQESFLRAYRSLPAFRGGCTFRSWILRIAINAARSLRARERAKKRWARTVRMVDSRAGTGGGPGEDTTLDVADPDTSGAPARLIERKEVKDALEKAIGELEDEAREIIVLRDIAGESYEAIAAALGVPIGTVKSRVHRARLELRVKMARFV